MAFAASKALMELRVAMCQSGAGSAGVRDFWAKNYASIKAANGKLPILLRESSGSAAKLTATYEFGVEKTVSVEGMSADAFGKELSTLMSSS